MEIILKEFYSEWVVMMVSNSLLQGEFEGPLGQEQTIDYAKLEIIGDDKEAVKLAAEILKNYRPKVAKNRQAKGPEMMINRVIPFGENHYRAKVNEAQVLEIFKFFKVGVPKKELARRYGISSKMIRKILNRESWKHL